MIGRATGVSAMVPGFVFSAFRIEMAIRGFAMCVVVAGFTCSAALKLRAQARPRMPTKELASSKTKIVFLGTGNPAPNPDKLGPSVAIIVNGTPYLVDAGVGIVRRAAAASRGGVKGLEMPNLRIVFLTHLHSDHTLGLPDLMETPWIMHRTAPLEVYGPVGTTAMA